MSSEPYQTVARVGELKEGLGQAFAIEGRMIALFLVDGTYFALDDACPHQGFSLFDGAVLDSTVTCLWHGWRFNLADGRWMDNPGVRVGTYPVRVVGDAIQVALNED
ncbi:MAG: non-heme iron oxygenase ferredoxin subunit [Isosphaeraceae bacterium]